MIQEWRLRPVEQADAPALQSNCWPEKTVEEVESRLSYLVAMREKGRIWGIVALGGQTVVGFGQLVQWGERYEISDLVVGERWRGQGAGMALIHRLLGIARERGVKEVEIGGAESNPRAVALYRRLGFREQRRVLLDLGRGPEPVIYFTISLNETGKE